MRTRVTLRAHSERACDALFPPPQARILARRDSFAMMKEHDRVVLTAPVPTEGLEVGDVGTVVHVYSDGKAFEVEFTTLDGMPAAVATVEAFAVRPVTSYEITHSRALTGAS